MDHIMYTITKSFKFSASHQLKGLPEGHACGRLHGHNYEVILTLNAELLDEVGFVYDYRALEWVKEYIKTTFDHRNINDIYPWNPTSENLAFHFYLTFKEKLYQLQAVTVKETDSTSATYEQTRR